MDHFKEQFAIIIFKKVRSGLGSRSGSDTFISDPDPTWSNSSGSTTLPVCVLLYEKLVADFLAQFPL
jgi:hypothetical protein